MARAQLYLIDAYGLCYRAYYAVKGLTNSKGKPTNAVFGFSNILRKLLNDLKPTHMAACFDLGKPTHRTTSYAAYKAQRQSMPDDLVSQIVVIRDLLECYNIPIFEFAGYEADDVMATLAAKFASKDTEVVIVTEDKDMGQLVGGPVKVYSARLEKVLETEDIQAKFGVMPNQIVDYIALAGDTSDNIPGVDGIGEVGARKLLNEFGTLEKIYAHIDEVKGDKLKEKLRNGKDAAFLSRELATLHAEVPLTVELGDMAMRGPDRVRLKQLYTDLEFRRLAEELNDDAIAPTEFDVSTFKAVVEVPDGKGTTQVVYDAGALRAQGIELHQQAFDVFLAGYLLAGGQNKYDITSLSWQYLNKAPHGEVLKDLYAPMRDAIKAHDMGDLLYKIEMPLTAVLAQMKKDGVRLNTAMLQSLSKECADKIFEIETALFDAAGTKFNINSPKQLSEVLFERLKLPVIKKTKTGFSTDEEVLTRLADKHPLPAMILEYRQISKLKSTYIDALPLLVDVKDSRLHATFNQTGADTGRLSSYDPNLQNIPIRSDFGRRIRGAFVPYTEGDILLAADYSQIELRILAHLAGDERLIGAFAKDEDIHRYTASLMFDVDEKKVDDKMRYAAKRINFGIVYGMSAFGLAKDLAIGPREAQEFIDKYFLRYPGVRTFLDNEIQKARDNGFVVTMFNRRRYLPDIHNRNMALRQFAERQAINAPIQGSAADFIKIAMVKIDVELRAQKFSSKMILTVHDELVFNVTSKELPRMIELVRTHMEGVASMSVAVKATVKTGKDWLSMKPVRI